jgi:hypothetical protein
LDTIEIFSSELKKAGNELEITVTEWWFWFRVASVSAGAFLFSDP